MESVPAIGGEVELSEKTPVLDAAAVAPADDVRSVKSDNSSVSSKSSAVLQNTLKNMQNKGSARKGVKATPSVTQEQQLSLMTRLKQGSAAGLAQSAGSIVTPSQEKKAPASVSHLDTPRPTRTSSRRRSATEKAAEYEKERAAHTSPRKSSDSTPPNAALLSPAHSTQVSGPPSLVAEQAPVVPAPIVIEVPKSNAGGSPSPSKGGGPVKRRRHYKGGTYGLYLSKRNRRIVKKNKENEQATGSQADPDSSGGSGGEDLDQSGDQMEADVSFNQPAEEEVKEEVSHADKTKENGEALPQETNGGGDLTGEQDKDLVDELTPQDEENDLKVGKAPGQIEVACTEDTALKTLLTGTASAPAAETTTSSSPRQLFKSNGRKGMISSGGDNVSQGQQQRRASLMSDNDSNHCGSVSTTGAAASSSSSIKGRPRTKKESLGDMSTPRLVYPMPPGHRRSMSKGISIIQAPSASASNGAGSSSGVKAETNGQQMLMKISGSGSITSNTSGLQNAASGDQASTKFILMTDSKNQAPFSTCLCTDKPQLSSTAHQEGKPLFCQAIDGFDGKMVGCCNQAGLVSLFRASKRVPYKVLCEVHLARLRRHHCCPGCGIFCSQGEFLECFAVKKQVHLFHKSCQVVQGLGAKRQHCPHCGQVSDQRSVRLEMNGPVNNNVYYLMQTPVLKTPRAKMSLAKLRELPAITDESNEAGFEYMVSDSKKVLSLQGLPLGPSRKQLEQLLNVLSNEKTSPTIKFINKNFYTVAKNGEVDKVLALLAQGFDPNYTFEENNNETPLHAAAQSGSLVIVHLLIQAGANLNVQNTSMETPLMQAIEAKASPVVKYLIKAGASVDVRGEDGMTALHIAARSGNAEAVSYILSSTKININLQDEGGWTALVWATEHKHLNIVKMLLTKGSDPSIQDDEENVGLHWAAFSGDVNIAYCLIEMGCDVNAANTHGDTALHISARRDNYECVVLLLSRGADLTIQNRNGETALEIAPKTTQSNLALKVNSELKRFANIRKINSDKYLYRDISKGKEPVQVPIVNGVDAEPVPIDYMYVSENCETSPINIDRTITSLQSCRCEDDCTSDSCICSAISFRCWYDREGKLVDDFNLLDPPMIFECNRACACWKTCYNRVVQFGVRNRLQVFRAKGNKGWGVRPLRDIPKGSFVCEYVGEIITDHEADRREDDSYLFDLDNRDGETYCLDARFYGNVARFINHLCEPNLTPVKVFVDHQDLSFPRIALFANRDIKAFEELGFDYGEKFWIIKYKWFLCECTSATCKYSKDAIDNTLQVYYSKIREELDHGQDRQ